MKTLIEILVKIIITLIQGVFESISFLINPNTNTQLFDDKLLTGRKKRKHISAWNKGLVINGKHRITVRQSITHTAVIGASGRGKTSTFFIPNLLKATNQNYIITDLDGAIYQKTSGYLDKQGYTIQVLNLNTITNGETYNPLALCQSDDDLKSLAEQIVFSSGASQGAKDQFWNYSSSNLLFWLFRVVQLLPKTDQHITNVRSLLTQLELPNFASWFSALAPTHLWTEYLSFQSKDPKLRTSIQASLSATLDLFSYAEISAVTSSHSLDLKGLRTKKSVLFVIVPERKLTRNALLLSVFWGQLFEFFQAHPPKNPVYCLLDEAGNYRIKDLSVLSTILRRYRVSISLGLQDISQLENLYGNTASQTIINNLSTKIIFAGASLKLANEISQMAGKRTVEIEFESQKKQQIKSLLTPTDIIQMDDRSLLVLISNLPPALVRAYPYFRQWKLNRRSKLPPKSFKTNAVTVPTPFLISQSTSKPYEKNESSTETV